jgi:hypothetical protein
MDWFPRTPRVDDAPTGRWAAEELLALPSYRRPLGAT